MEIGSKLAIFKIEKLTDKKGNPYYKGAVLEYVYNKAKKVGGSWEMAKYPVYIMDTHCELEAADFSLGVNPKNKYDFKNISNPDKSIIRVYDFKYEEHFMWNKAGNEKLKNEDGYAKTKALLYINKLEINNKRYVTTDTKLSIAEKRIKEYQDKNKEIRLKLADTERKLKRLEETLSDKDLEILDAKNEVKAAHKRTMVVRRKNTINEMKLERANANLDIEKQKVQEIKHMKKQEIINKAKEIAFTFEDI